MTYVPAFPKPKDAPKIKWAPVLVHPDGREFCRRAVKAGKAEYKRRIAEMWTRQNGLCCLCDRPLTLDEATFEHQDGRGMGGSHQDDRIEINGLWYNGAAHYSCNYEKGSRHIDYNAKHNAGRIK